MIMKHIYCNFAYQHLIFYKVKRAYNEHFVLSISIRNVMSYLNLIAIFLLKILF